MVKIPDPSQRKAIFAPPEQSILVTAPPGYGKTYVMPKRLAFLIKSGSLVPPERALGLTFTNAAASEMLTRVEKNIGSRYIDFIDAMTFHSFCYQVLRSHGDAIGLSIDFSIFPEGAKKRLYEEKLKKNKISTKTYSWYDYRDWENERVVRLSSTSDQTYPFWNFWRGYRQYQKSKAKVDFNHLLWFTYNLFINRSDILDIYIKAYKYILVDEYQDTTPIQFALLDLLIRGDAGQPESTGGSPVFIFGDDWQSIYGFLGAVPENHMEKAKNVFGCSVVELTHDHRVSSPALSLLGKALRDTSGKPADSDESTIPLYVLETPTEMADRVNATVNQWVEAGIPLHDIAILARNRGQLGEVQKALSFDYLNVPDLQANQIEDNAVFKVLMDLAERRVTARSLRYHLINHTQQVDVSKGERYIRNILITLAGNYDLRFKDLKISERARLMANEALLEINWGQQLKGYCQDRIFTGTLHSAKGLEFRSVAIVHLDCDSFPYWPFVCKHCKKGMSVEHRLQEEWRVFYVGVTRASEHLALFSSATNQYGYSTPVSCLIEPRIQSHLRIHDSRGEKSAEQPLSCEYRKRRNVLNLTKGA